MTSDVLPAQVPKSGDASTDGVEDESSFHGLMIRHLMSALRGRTGSVRQQTSPRTNGPEVIFSPVCVLALVSFV